MITLSPRPATSTPAARSRGDRTWQLLSAGDEVSIAGQGRYEVIHLSQGSAWLEGCADGAQCLVSADALQLVRAGHSVQRQ
jgi:hypothetical protein